MIEINLIPGGRKAKRSGGSSVDFRAMLGELGQRVRDPWLATAVVGGVLGLGATGFMYWRTDRREADLTTQETTAVQDSTRYATVLREMNVAQAQRDSVVRQIAVISSIDRSRYVWPHVLDEVSRALPPYTWLRSIQQTSAVPAVSPEAAAGVATKGKTAAAAQAEADEAAAAAVVTLRIIGQSADVQAITRFYRQLQDSPWFGTVNLTRTEDVLVQPSNKEVKEFTIEIALKQPDSTQIRRVPLTVGVR
ncbi:MAG TPA: PilN domain-containing protein [Gemmatimonadaceae bacterium]|nr:PilN domain-containing protein [Gemmatimonadaceae bacterium]